MLIMYFCADVAIDALSITVYLISNTSRQLNSPRAVTMAKLQAPGADADCLEQMHSPMLVRLSVQ